MDLCIVAPASVATAARRGVLGCARVRPLKGLRQCCPSVRVSVATTESVAAAIVASSADEDAETTNLRTVVVVILGGHVPIGDAYSLIDVPMSNCINSGINKVYVLTQFNSTSLNRHLSRAYNFSNGVGFGDGFIEVLAAIQRPRSEVNRWFQGSADAVRQFAWLFDDAKSKDIEDVLILSGDHLYVWTTWTLFRVISRETRASVFVACLLMTGDFLSISVANVHTVTSGLPVCIIYMKKK